MIELKTPRGLSVRVPEWREEDPSPKFSPDDGKGIGAYYEQNGYVVVEGLFRPETCDRMRELWDAEIKPSDRFIYRQATAKAERHVFNARKWIMNPILNLQSVDPRRYPEFRRFATEEVLASGRLSTVFRTLLGGENPKIVQSMYFEGNSATWEHQDSYYLDSEKVGAMAAAWIALEDITVKAGRFFVCPGSHRIDLGKQGMANNIADNHEVYIQQVVGKIAEQKLEIRAPALQKGDVLFWNAWTIHGSLDSHDPDHPRSSITCHAIPESQRLLQLQSRIMPLNLASVHGIKIHRPKDLGQVASRIVFGLETRFPRAFYAGKKLAIRTLMRVKQRRREKAGIVA